MTDPPATRSGSAVDSASVMPFSYVARRDAGYMRWARAAVALAIPALLLSANLPDDPAPIVSPLILGVLVAGALLLVNVVDPTRLRAADPDLLRRRAVAELGIDTAAVVSVVWLAGVDPKGSLWVLLLLPLLEAALRFGTRVSVVVLASMMVTYIARDIWASAYFEAVTFSPAIVVQRVGVLLVVGVTAGFLASQLAKEATRHEHARAEAVRRADTLEVVADAARRMTSLDASDVYRNLALAARDLGAAEVGLAFRRDTVWVPMLHTERDAGANGPSTGFPADGHDDHVLDLRDPDRSDAQPQGLPTRLDLLASELAPEVASTGHPLTFGPAHLRDVEVADNSLPGAVGVPIIVSGDVRAVMVIGQIVSNDLHHALDLLAAQAGAVLTQAEAHDEIRRLQQRLAHQAFHDSLTGLPNRANFDRRLKHRRDRRSNSGDGVAVLFIDLDGFKTVNDTLGHRAGDRTLEVVASRIRETIRPGDSVARLGGDEFVVLLDRTADIDGARAAAERILDVLGSPIRLGQHQVTIGASIGIACRDEVPDDPEKLIRLADRAMYEAKRTGRGRIVAVDEIAADESKQRQAG